jgi:threonine dehydrogenase-like Zn-dependent dehydrogenase
MIGRVLRAHKTLTTETDLSPNNPAINEALTSLVTGITQPWTVAEEQEVLNDPRVKAVHKELVGRCAVAEGEMEKYWAAHFNARGTLTNDDFQDFIYWACYDRLVNGEIKAMPQMNDKGEGKIAFAGAGPLPLTALILHQKTGRRITCIDNDPVACDLSRELLAKAGIKGIDVVCAAGADFDYKDYPFVFIASLVPEKDKVVEKIRERGQSTFIGVRSVERLHVLLYEPVDEKTLKEAGCRFASKTKHDNKTINTTLFYKADALAPVVKPHMIAPKADSSKDLRI